jgi:hypothetical protein
MRPNAAGLRFGRVVTVKPDQSNAHWNIFVVEPLLSIEKEYVVELWIAPRSEASDVEDVP